MSAVDNRIGGNEPLPNQPGSIDPSQIGIQVVKASIGLVFDTLDPAFVDNLGNLKRYSTESSRPTIPPVNTYVPPEGEGDQAAANLYQKFIDDLPPELQALLGAQNGLPPAQQNPQALGLDNLLQFVAKLIPELQVLGQTRPTGNEPGSLDKAQKGSWNANAAAFFTFPGVDTPKPLTAPPASGAVQGPNAPDATDAENPMSTLLSNAVNVMGVAKLMLQQTADSIPADDPHRQEILTYLKAIGDAIQALMTFLNMMSSEDAKSSLMLSHAERDTIQDKLEKALQKIADAYEEMRKAKALAAIMKIFGPIIAAVLAAATIATMGAATPLAIGVAVAIEAATIAVTVADSCTGFMSEPIGDAMKNMSTGMKILVIVAVIAALIILSQIAAGLAGAVGGMARAGATAEAKAGLKEGVEELSKETLKHIDDVAKDSQAVINNAANRLTGLLGVTLISATNVIADFITDILKKCGVAEDKARIIGQVMQMIIAMIVLMKSLKVEGIQGASPMAKQMSNYWQNTMGFAGTALGGASGVIQGITNEQLAAMQLQQGEFEKAIKTMDGLLAAYSMSMDSINEEITRFGEGQSDLNNVWSTLVASLSNSMAQLWNIKFV